MKTVLSTKKLSISQRERLLRNGLAVVDYDFIACQYLNFTKPTTVVENAIFTSQNGVKATLGHDVVIKNVFCVGKRTEKLLNEKGYTVTEMGCNAQELSEKIIEGYNQKQFTYFCPEKRLDTLPNRLQQHKVAFEEIPVYRTLATPREYTQVFDAILFFSPSGVESYFSINKEVAQHFSIGITTATALKKYTNQYIVANKPSVENVLVKVIKHFKS